MAAESYTEHSIRQTILRLLDYCEKSNWAGYDPYDALNSKVFQALPLLDFRLFRLGLTQLLKRSPINIRPPLLIPKTQNPKGIALFLMAFLKLKKLGLLPDEKLIPLMIDKLIELRSPQERITGRPRAGSSVSQLPSFPASQPSGSDPSYFCWGYSFPWQTRTILVPRWAPNLVCTSFVANALLDAYETHKDHRCLEMAISAAEYILNELYWKDDDCVCFAYPTPSSRARVHNANFLGAALLCRVAKLNGDRNFLEPALKVARYSAEKQNEDGAWYYGEHSTQHWVDNFHTGYNLCALHSICGYAETKEFEPHMSRGLKFYQNHLFTNKGVPKYFHNRTYPIDSHSVAQTVITLLTLQALDEGNAKLAQSVFGWAMSHMWDAKGYYYYQKLPCYTIKIPYMRWSQAWMLYASAILFSKTNIRNDKSYF